VRATFVIAAVVVAITAAATGTAVASAQVSAGSASTAPFTWQGAKWCPTLYGGDGCDNIQRGDNSTAAFSPSQVLIMGNSSGILLEMNSAASQTGAFNTQGYETWSAPSTLSEQINLPCNSASQIKNWPAFWLVTTGSWPAGGEIDIMEGLSGSAAWHYHYVNSSGTPSAVGGPVSGFKGCGIHTYAVNWTTAAITFYYDGKEAGRVTPAEIGVRIAPGPMYVINNYAASSVYGGPTADNAKMEILKFTSTRMNS
jgi:glycosyl hydrolase family 16